MTNCILYKCVTKSFLKQVLFAITLLVLSTVLITLNLVSNSTSNENIPYHLFLIILFLGALLVLISSYKGRKGSIENLKMIKEKKEFDEVIFESTISEIFKPKKNSDNSIPYLLFIKNRGRIIFQMMFKPDDFSQILNFMKDLSHKRNVIFTTKIDESKIIIHSINLLLPEVS
ncbi:MAG: hypothetical protein WC139_07515 [Candidatus Kapaibacterium sp.]